MSATASEAIEERKDAEDSPRSAAFWKIALAQAAKQDETWEKRARKVVERYRGEAGLRAGADGSVTGERQFNILHSNTETLRGALYARPARPDVRRRWPDKQPISRHVAIICERALEYIQDRYDEQSTIEAVVEDYLLPGRGVAWVCYDPVTVDGYTDHRIYEEYVYWEDYREAPARKWPGVTWVARRHKLTREQMRELPALKDKAEEIPLNWEPDGENLTDEIKEVLKQAEVWEIWDRGKRERLWVSKDMENVIKAEEDPYNLENFFPCPEPLLSIPTNGTRVPVPEFTIYQHQADELDRITQRLARLTEALKRRGVYDAEIKELSRLAEAKDNEFIPSQNFQLLASKGGLPAVFQQEDIQPIAQVVLGLMQQRDQLVQTIYEITGISDVIRGATDPNETATAQRLKGQFGSQRLKKRQGRVQRFIRDLYRIKGELIAENLDPKTLSEMTGIMLPTGKQKEQAKQVLERAQGLQQQGKQVPPNIVQQVQAALTKPSWDDIMKVMRDDKLRSYRIDIETDSTVFEDEQMEKQSRIEYIQAVGGFLQGILPVAQASPSMAKLGLEMLGFMSRGFKVGRQLEDTIDEASQQAVKEMQQAIEAAKQQQADPTAQVKLQTEQVRAQAAQAKAGAEIEKTKLGIAEAQMDAQHAEQEHQFDMAKLQADLSKLAMEMEAARQRHAMQMEAADTAA